MNRLPKILLLTEAPVSLAHGTGACLLRNLETYPPHLIQSLFPSNRSIMKPAGFRHWVWDEAEVPPFPLSVRARFRGLTNELLNGGSLRSISSKELWRNGVRRGRWDMVYALVCADRGLRMLENVIQLISPRVPMVMHFVDLYPNSSEKSRFLQRLKQVIERSNALWVLTNALAEDLKEWTGRTVERVPFFSTRLLPAPERATRERKGTQGIILGNFWRPEMFDEVVGFWREVRKRRPEVPALLWYAHPNAIKRINRDLRVSSDVIDLAGMLEGESLVTELAKADFSVLPFNSRSLMEKGGMGTDYARYSLPSRMVETCLARLPLFVLATRETETAQYVESRGIGVIGEEDPTQLVAGFLRFLDDQEKMDAASKACARVAEHEMSQQIYMEDLVERWKSVIDAHHKLVR
jgi:hypothetical protein